ncbi:conserved hypothetical protein [Beutenbergia cavernae DSM 12333]|uniref:Heavy metal-binding domain-containing protein n=1 Tax=Beutenbergia cavernae (strain ATCC BAA-8 / DSM 12333 / CCUG 43141 / JCM 11478 / NBRC 16432 / NCIMB 13614 / HKI 0122) TaxID=471853 RepID=C5C5C0_BEUC1|nr:hypothetical protein [Beutenbergia cavernae]ACQ82260.1 conserved hypothetical protein [Beutenbergia cavernae DSM 12333]
MRTPTRLGLFGAGLAAIFAATFAVGSAVIPDDAAAGWADTDETREAGDDMSHEDDMTSTEDPAAPAPDDEASHEDGAAEAGGTHDDGASGGHGEPVRGLSLEQDGYVLSEVTAPGGVGEAGDLSFRVDGGDGHPLTAFAESHEKRLHLIVVRSDGSEFRHVHPEMSDDGTWTIPWTWDEPGTYRVFADFVPADGAADDPPDVTLTRSVDVEGAATPSPATTVRTTTSVDGFDVTLDGELLAGADSTLTATITRAGEDVTTLEPYLGAFGHLVALRQGDLAYLHVHPEGAEPAAGDVSGPEVVFATQAPTPGRYLLYLDFQVDGEVHTAAFVLDAAADHHAPESSDDGNEDSTDGGEH